MARSTRTRLHAAVAAVLSTILVSVLASGCVSGHAWQAARRWERVDAYREARVVGDRLLVHYTAAVTTDEDQRVGERSRWAEISLAELRAAPPVERFRVREYDDEPDVAAAGEAVAVCEATPEAEASPCARARPSLCLLGDDGAAGFVLAEEAGTYPAFHSAALTRTSVAPWVYPVLPFSFAVDAVMVPGLVLLAPLWIVLGD
jgi:hypothetical protein